MADNFLKREEREEREEQEEREEREEQEIREEQEEQETREEREEQEIREEQEEQETREEREEQEIREEQEKQEEREEQEKQEEREEQEKQEEREEKIIKNLDPLMFKKVGAKTPQIFLENDPVLVPLQRTEFDEIMIALKNMSITMEKLLKQTGDIEKNILLTENNNNISDSETKKFIEMTINKSLEQLKDLITETSNNLEPNDIIIIVKNAPSKQMLKINSETTNNIIKKIIENGGQCYITDNNLNLSKQINEIKKTEMLERGEDINLRQERIHIKLNTPEPDISSEEEEEA
jgi:hypothetical protein